MIDYAFSHLLVWSGQMGLRAYQIHLRESPERMDGDCVENEVEPRTLNSAGCSGLEVFVQGDVFDVFTGYAEGMAKTSYGTDIYIRRTTISALGADNATALAKCAVQQIINALGGTDIAPGVYDTFEAEIGSGTYVVVNPGIVANGQISVSWSGGILVSGGTIDLGVTNYLAAEDFVFTIKNTGSVIVEIGTVTATGTGFSVTVQPLTFIGIGGSATFTVHYDASAPSGGTFPVVIIIPTNV
jgi:hypothetical protein